jgi:hypothetical protein
MSAEIRADSFGILHPRLFILRCLTRRSALFIPQTRTFTWASRRAQRIWIARVSSGARAATRTPEAPLVALLETFDPNRSIRSEGSTRTPPDTIAGLILRLGSRCF